MAESLASQVLQHIHRLVPRSGLDAETDAALLGRFAARRDEDAFAALMTRHGPMVLGVCRRVLGDAHAAEDAFQAVFLVLARKAAAISRPDALAAWLYGVARRVARKARTHGRRRGIALPVPLPAAPCADPLAELSARELLAIIDEEVGHLPEVYRLPVLLCCLEGLSQEEAARRLGWTPGSVKGRLERGRVRLHARLMRRGLTLPAVLAAAELSRAAGLRPELADRVMRTALAAGDTVPAGVLVLAEGVSHGSTVVGLKVALALLVAALAVAGGGMLAQPAPPEERRGVSPPAERPAHRVAPADPLPAGAVARLGSVRFRPGSTVESIAFAPDGRGVASGNGDGSISLWEADTGRELRVLRGHPDAVLSVAFSPDGKLLASRGGGVAYNDNSIVLWELATGKEVRSFGASRGQVPSSFTGSPAWAFEVAFSPDGKLLAAVAGNVLPTDDTIRLWDVGTGREVRRCRGHTDRIRCFAFAPDGKLLASGGADRMIRLWDPATGKELRRLTGHRKLVRALAFSPAGTVLVSAGDDQTVRLWETATGKEVRRLAVQGEPLSVAFTDERTLAWGDTQGEVHLVEAATGKELRRLSRQPSRVGIIRRSPDGKRLATASDGQDYTVYLWDVGSGRRPALAGHEAPLFGLAFAPEGRTLATGSADGTVRLWDATTGMELRRPRERLGLVSALACSPDGKILAVVSDGGTVLSLREATSFRELRRLRNPGSGWFTSCVFSPDGRTLVTGGNRFNREWDGTVCLWDVATGKELRQLKGHVNNVRSVACSSDGRLLASGGEDGTARLWDTATGKELYRPEGHDGFVMAVAFSPDGRTLAAAAARSVQLWDVATGKKLRRFEGEENFLALAYSPDGSTLAVGCAHGQRGPTDYSVQLRDAETGQLIRRWEGHRNFIQAVAFAPDGRTVASAGYDGLALVWDVTGLLRQGRLPALRPTRRELEGLWDRLALEDARRSHDAVWRLVAAGGPGVDFLRERLRPVPPADARRLARLVANLDSGSFRIREEATTALEQLGEAAAPALRKTLEGKPSPEVRRRLEQILGALKAGARPPEHRRRRRTLQVLVLAGTASARELLRSYAAGAPGARLTEDAKEALHRLLGRMKDEG